MFDFDRLMTLVDARIDQKTRLAGVMTLGHMRDCLALVPPQTPVVFADHGAPGPVDSYRGYYDRLAFCTVNTTVTAADVIADLNNADGRTFEGYKGGSYVMGPHTFLHRAEWGRTGTYVSGLRIVDRRRVVVDTAVEDW